VKMTIGSITNVNPEKLQALYELLDDIGVNHEYSRANGELAIYAGDIGILFEADRKLMEEAIEEAYWQEDAERIAEGYWRQ
jgi:hypothetical protein